MLETIPFFILIFLINLPPLMLHFLGLKYKSQRISRLKWLTLIGLSIFWMVGYAHARYSYISNGYDDGSEALAKLSLIASLIVLIPQYIYFFRNTKKTGAE